LKRTKAEANTKKAFEARKHRLAEAFLSELDTTITASQVQQLSAATGGVRFIWSKTLNSTAGRANWRRETTRIRNSDGSVETLHKHHASIELAEKVIDDEHRLLNVVAHEFCHLANFMVSGIKDQPHGRQFKVWGAKCTEAFAERGVVVTTKHSYQIEYKYMWRCGNEECEAEFKRHSKSIDPARQRCGQCKGGLVQVKPVPRGGGGAVGEKGKQREVKGYAAFVQANFKDVQESLPVGASQKDVMEAMGKRYRAEKESGGAVSHAGKEDASGIDVDNVARVLQYVILDDD